MPTPAYTVVCSRKTLVVPGVYELVFTRPEGMTFKPGQFVLFDVPLQDNPADIQTRALSIASAPTESDLLFVLKLKPGGRISEWVEHAVTEGFSARMQGPFGLFTLKEPEQSYVFVGTGAGVAPFRSQLKWALEEKGDKRPMHLLFGTRMSDHFFWLPEFESLAKRFSNFTFHPTVSGQDAGWKGLEGRVQTHLPKVVHGLPLPGLYICGAPGMVQDVKKECLELLKLPKAQVHAEGYI